MKRARAGRHHPRGMTLLIALAVISVVTAATLVSLRIVSQESELQGRERHSREAFFAAEAGLAEGREVLIDISDEDSVRGLPSLSLNRAIESLAVVSDPSFPRNLKGWRVLMPTTSYTLAAGNGKALDPKITVARREMRDINNKPFVSFPEQSNVSYRVFVHDDDSSPQNDADNTLWLVSMGEVTGKDGVVLARSVVRALVTSSFGAGEGPEGSGQRGGGATKGGSSAITPVDMGKSTRIP